MLPTHVYTIHAAFWEVTYPDPGQSGVAKSRKVLNECFQVVTGSSGFRLAVFTCT